MSLLRIMIAFSRLASISSPAVSATSNTCFLTIAIAKIPTEIAANKGVVSNPSITLEIATRYPKSGTKTTTMRIT